MEELGFYDWVRQQLEKEGYIGDDLEGKVRERLLYVPKDLQKLAEDALFRPKAKAALLLYIESLSDLDKHVQIKRELLEGYVRQR